MKKRNEFYSEAIGVKFFHDHLKALDIEWILWKLNKSSKKAYLDINNNEISRLPMEIRFNDSKELIFIFLPSEEFFDSLQDLYRLTTRTFINLKDTLERSRKRKNINKIRIMKLNYDGDKFSKTESHEIIFERRENEKPLTEF